MAGISFCAHHFTNPSSLRRRTGSEARGAVVNDSPVGCQSRDLTEARRRDLAPAAVKDITVSSFRVTVGRGLAPAAPLRYRFLHLFAVGRRALTPPHLITKQTNQLSRTIIECAKRRGAVPPPYDVRMKIQLNPGRILHLFSVGTALRSAPYIRGEAALFLFECACGRRL